MFFNIPGGLLNTDGVPISVAPGPDWMSASIGIVAVLAVIALLAMLTRGTGEAGGGGPPVKREEDAPAFAPAHPGRRISHAATARKYLIRRRKVSELPCPSAPAARNSASLRAG